MTNEEMEGRINTLEEVVVMLASQQIGSKTSGFNDLRALNRISLAKMSEGVIERVRQKIDEATERIQFTGLNIPEVRTFVANGASIIEEGLDVYLVHNGTSDILRRGSWIYRDPVGGHVYIGR